MEKRRLTYLDLAKGIGIILVAIAHSTFTSTPVQAFITAFHMPLFFVVSGMLLCHTGEEKKSMKVLAKKKAMSVMIPYLTFSIAYVIIKIATIYLKPGRLTWIDVERSLIEFATLYGISVLWFMSALFLGEMMFLFWKRKCNKWRYGDWIMGGSAVLAGVILTVGSPLFLTYYPLYRTMPILWVGYYIIVLLRSLGAFSFLTVGYYGYQCYLKKADEKKIRNKKQLIWQELAVGVLCFLLVLAVSQKNGVVDIHFLTFSNPVLYYLGAIGGSFGVVLLCRQVKRGRFLAYLGVNSLIIMATHLDFQVLITSIDFANWMNQYVTRAKVYVLYFNIALMMTLLEVILIYVINHFLPFMVGKRYRRGLKLVKTDDSCPKSKQTDSSTN